MIPASGGSGPAPAGWGVVVGAAGAVGLVAAVSGIYFARGFLLPVVLAILGRFVLAPVVRALKARGVPEPLGALAAIVLDPRAHRGLLPTGDP